MAGSSSSSARYQLLGGQGGDSQGGMRSVGWGDFDEEDDELEEVTTRGVPVGQIKAQQYQALEDQDRGLEELSRVIGRQKTLARAIGDEVEYQNELIDDITTHVDRTRDRIHGETQRVRTIDRKDSTCAYWTVILILLAVIIIIVAL